jgi:alginate O-acetyltransferase complex protein AlgJ
MSTRVLQSIHAWIFTGLVVVVALAALTRARTFDPPPIKEELIDGRVAHAFESHYDEAFPIRNFGISVWAAIEYVLFREARSGVVIGRDGWLYTDEEFIVPSAAQEDVARNVSLIAYVQRELAKKGTRLMMVVVPAKARVYPEHLGRRQPPALHRDLHERIESALLAHHVPVAGVLPALQAGKSRAQVFLRTDTHWTPQGARLAAQATAISVRDLVPPGTKARVETRAAGTRDHRGDLFNFLPLEPWFGFLLPAGE